MNKDAIEQLEKWKEIPFLKNKINENNIELVMELVNVMKDMTEESTRCFVTIYSNFACETPEELVVYACENWEKLPDDRIVKSVKATHNIFNKLILEAMKDQGL